MLVSSRRILFMPSCLIESALMSESLDPWIFQVKETSWGLADAVQTNAGFPSTSVLTIPHSGTSGRKHKVTPSGSVRPGDHLETLRAKREPPWTQRRNGSTFERLVSTKRGGRTFEMEVPTKKGKSTFGMEVPTKESRSTFETEFRESHRMQIPLKSSSIPFPLNGPVSTQIPRPLAPHYTAKAINTT